MRCLFILTDFFIKFYQTFIFIISFLFFFSGLRGAVAFAQSLHLPLANKVSRNLIMTTTLAIVVFTNIVLGGMTLPLIKV